MVHLGKKKRAVLAILLQHKGKAISSSEIYSGLVKQDTKISKRTVKNTLDEYNQYNKLGNPSLVTKELDKITGRTCFRITPSIDTFIELARNLLITRDSASIFFKSRYAQNFLQDINLINHIEENLNLVFDDKTRDIIHQIIQNSPSALCFGLFSENLLSQKARDTGYLKDNAEHEIRENFISGLLNDLRDKDFFLSDNTRELIINVGMQWKFKEKKESKFNLELRYK